MHPRFENPHVDVHHGPQGLSAEQGKCPGHVHASCPKAGLDFQCIHCHKVTRYTWDELDAANEQHLAVPGGTDSVRLPPCSCGTETFLNNSDVEYHPDLPHHYTLKAVAEHIATRPAFRRLKVNRHAAHERRQGH